MKQKEAQMDLAQVESETITIKKATYRWLYKRNKWLCALEAAGVDNWEGYGWARETMEDDDD